MTGPDPSSLIRELLDGTAPFALIARDDATVEVLTGTVVDVDAGLRHPRQPVLRRDQRRDGKIPTLLVEPRHRVDRIEHRVAWRVGVVHGLV